MNRRGFFRRLVGAAVAAATAPVTSLVDAAVEDDRTLAQRLRDLHITTAQLEELGGQRLDFKVMAILPVQCWSVVPEVWE